MTGIQGCFLLKIGARRIFVRVQCSAVPSLFRDSKNRIDMGVVFLLCAPHRQTCSRQKMPQSGYLLLTKFKCGKWDLSACQSL